jgi:hypothetical protein
MKKKKWWKKLRISIVEIERKKRCARKVEWKKRRGDKNVSVTTPLYIGG